MFRTPNPYDELVAAGTAETLTDVNWERFLEVCDKVSDEGETGARNAISAILKRLAHRNPNVQTFALELTNSLSENCGRPVRREISSKSFTDGLERVVTDRTTAAPVRTKVLSLVRKWNEEFEGADEDDGALVHELYDRLAKNADYAQALTGSTRSDPAPEDVERAREAAEEAELARVLELSKQETGGRHASGPSRSAGGSGSASSSSAVAANPGGSSSSAARGSSNTSSTNHRSSSLPQQPQATAASSSSSSAQATADERPQTPPLQQAVRVRALYTYAPSNPTELAFEAGQSIKVIGRTYDQWWRGTLAGRVGIFPVNYVEPLPAPSAAELRQEREEEDELFERIAGFDELLERLRAVEPGRPIPEDVEELYASCVGLQARLGALIGKYAGAKAELETLSNIFAQAAFSYQAMKNPHVAPPPPQMYAHPHQYAQQPQQQPQQYNQQPPALAAEQQPAYAGGPAQAASEQHPAGAGQEQAAHQPAAVQQQHMSPEWQAYYAQQAAAARGQAGQIPGQQPVLEHPPAAAAGGQHHPPQPQLQQQGSYDGQQQQLPHQPQQRHVSQGSLHPSHQHPPQQQPSYLTSPQPSYGAASPSPSPTMGPPAAADQQPQAPYAAGPPLLQQQQQYAYQPHA